MTKQTEKKYLNKKDRYILKLMTNGLKTQEIAKEIGYSKLTLDSYRRDIYKFLGARNGVHAIVIALQKGILKLEELNKPPTDKPTVRKRKQPVQPEE